MWNRAGIICSAMLAIARDLPEQTNIGAFDFHGYGKAGRCVDERGRVDCAKAQVMGIDAGPWHQILESLAPLPAVRAAMSQMLASIADRGSESQN